MRKRLNGEGSVFKNEKTGRWAAQVSYYHNGKRKRKTKISKNSSDAKANLKKLHKEIGNGLNLSDTETVGGYLKSWLDDVKRQHSTNTYQTYKSITNTHIIPKVGTKKLVKLTPVDVQKMINELCDEGLGSRSVQMSYEYLKRALNKAYKYRLIRENPCGPVDKPKHTPGKPNPLTVEEVNLLLDYLKDHRLYCICYTALTTGMRSGELFGLFWENVDLDENKIHVVQQLSTTGGVREIKKPKTKASYRTIDISDQTVDALIEQRKDLVKRGFASNEHVFCAMNGGLLVRDNFYAAWKRILKKTEIKHRGFHQLRHTFATLAISNGAPITVVSETLGHSSTAMTLDIYSHVLPSMKSDATNTVSKMIG